MRRLLFLTLLLFLLVGCASTPERIDVYVHYVDAPPSGEITPTLDIPLPTNTVINRPAPTPTAEVFTPVPTAVPTDEQGIEVVNTNPLLCGDNVVVTITTADGRWQAQPDTYTVVAEPGSNGVPAWVNYRDRPGSTCNYVGIELVEIDGRYGYETRLQLNDDQCYLVKLTGYASLSLHNPGKGELRDVGVWAQVDGVSLGEQGFDSWFGPYEHIWAFRAGGDVFVSVRAGVFARWAVYGTGSEYEMRLFEVLAVPDGFCPGAPVIGA